jgi:hypothetical protein
MLENKVFADIEEKELKKAKLILKLEKSWSLSIQSSSTMKSLV